MILAESLLEARFEERLNRYLAAVTLDQQEIEAFVPNPGRMTELMIPGVAALVRKAGNPNRKTRYDLVALWYEDEWVCIDSQAPNKIVFELLNERKFEEFAPYPEIKKEVSYLNSRFDFYLSGKDKGCFIEAKSCTLVEDGVALFPDAPTKRGTRHVHELIEAVEDGYEAYVLIVIQSGRAKV
ncbi:MAG: DNA/RNA nuclease SfsA, partial [Spirochaetota bacterium]|nr:DNA/RNA nuclease SfsA [Spirochaetota bacterium]